MTAPLTPAFTSQDPIGQLADASVELAMLADRSATNGPWASGAMHLLASRGVLAAFVPADCGGTAADEPALLDILTAIASTCLTTALAVSQWAAAVRIIATATPDVRTTLLPPLARGELFTTVGTSQLTTSRQHLGQPALVAARDGDGWRLDGLCPWVTGADACHTFFVVRTDARGILIDPPLELLALSGTRTAVVHFAGVCQAHLITPPERTLARTGGLATTALALGAARAAIRVVAGEANRRDGLAPVAAGLAAELASLLDRLGRAAREGIEPDDRDVLRGDANGLVLRTGQAALTASKGAGFVRGHPAERLVRESLFFLVWSCPQAVSSALLCELAGLG